MEFVTKYPRNDAALVGAVMAYVRLSLKHGLDATDDYGHAIVEQALEYVLRPEQAEWYYANVEDVPGD